MSASRSVLPLWLLAFALAGCGDGSTLLLVDLRTDLVPGVESDEVRTTVLAADREVVAPADASTDYARRAVRVARFDDLPRGPTALRVEALRRGAVVVGREVLVRVSAGATGVTVPLSRDCREL